MTLEQTTTCIDARQERSGWNPLLIAQTCAAFADPMHRPASQRQYATEVGIPRSTLASWLNKEFPSHLDPAFISFFRSPVGLAFLRRLFLALLFVFRHQSSVGFRPVAQFLELTDLHHFVGSSVGSLHAWDAQLQDLLTRFGQEQRQGLSEQMPSRDILLCLDEHFHSKDPCLIGIEPVSNFILVEAYHPDRKATTWATAIREGISDLPVHLVAFTSDQGSSLIRCAVHEFQIPHWPELFHLQHDLLGPICPALSRPIHKAEKELQQATAQAERMDALDREHPGTISIDTYFETMREEAKARICLQECEEQRDAALKPIREIALQYHPFDRESGLPVSAEQMQSRLLEQVEKVQTVVQENGLSERAQEEVKKARGWVVLLAGCLGYFTTWLNQRLEKLELSREVEQVVREKLLGSYYWEKASQRENQAKERERLKKLAEQLREQAWAEGGVLASLSADEKEELERECREGVGLFSRSSSCVEGRNGRLALFQHGQTRVSQRRLQALSVVHNYVLRRTDGTTAAERFFGQQHADAFSWLLQRMPDLPGPAAKRPAQPARTPANAG